MLEQSIDNFKLQQLLKIREKKMKFYSIVFQVRDKLDAMLEIVLEENFVTIRVKTIYNSKLFIICNGINKLLVAKYIIRTSFDGIAEAAKTIFSPLSG